MITKHTGSKYAQTKDLDVAEIAKLIRKDIKASETLQGLKVSVTISRYSMGRAITAHAQPSPETAIAWVNPAWCDEDDAGYVHTQPRYTPAAVAVQAELELILASYNEVEHDAHTDYNRSRFHADVTIGANYSGAIMARRQARRAAA